MWNLLFSEAIRILDSRIGFFQAKVLQILFKRILKLKSVFNGKLTLENMTLIPDLFSDGPKSNILELKILSRKAKIYVLYVKIEKETYYYALEKTPLPLIFLLILVITTKILE